MDFTCGLAFLKDDLDPAVGFESRFFYDLDNTRA